MKRSESGEVEEILSSSLIFRLDVDADGWPPVGAEGMSMIECERGVFEITVCPFFLLDLSVGDQITVSEEEEKYVTSWTHRFQSDRSTIWLLGGEPHDLEPPLERIRKLGCHIGLFKEFKLCSTDIPPTVSEEEIDDVMLEIEAAGAAVAYPSFRH